MALTLVAFLAAGSLILLVSLLLTGHNRRIEARVQDLADENRAAPPRTVAALARQALPRIGTAIVPEDGAQRTRLQARLIHAGFYSRHAMGVFLGIKMLLMMVPIVAGLAAGLLGLQSLLYCMIYGLTGGAVGILAPGFWLDWRKRKRQFNLRRALPDALDVVVICLEGGLSLQGAFERVATALRSAHPLLATEVNIIQREIQLGRSTGEAMRQFADRSDLEEVRSLASVVLQAERLGASIVKSLRVYADSFRTKRLQRAEEMAQKASTKIVFPTILFIFPAILFVIAAPAVFLLMDLFATMGD
ncbi:MAG TPA: type II secretion system F family protein [Gemmataceae bacterium]|jgi:tight adherence protein C|nr:type II secretion system F family protein [Gemmataceae bacterium]